MVVAEWFGHMALDCEVLDSMSPDKLNLLVATAVLPMVLIIVRTPIN